MADDEHKAEDKHGRSIKEGALQPEANPTGQPPKSGAGAEPQSAEPASAEAGNSSEGSSQSDD